MNRGTLAGLAALVVLAFIASETLFTVGQTEQVLVTQFGQVVRVIDTPGLHAKIPLVQAVIPFDKRLLDYEVQPEEVILGDQRRLIVDSFTRFRIVNPLLYYQAVGPTEDAIRTRLTSVVSSALRRVLGNEQLLNVLSSDRDRIMSLIRGQVNSEMKSFGIAVADVRIRRADLPPENTQAILSRMQSERQRVAAQARAEGAEASARIRANAERERTVLLAQARATADKLRGEGEGTAIATYAAAFERDPHFFSVWRTLQAYRAAFAAGKDRLVLTPGDGFLDLLGTAPVPAASPPIAAAPKP
ncbi:MAG: protease modulator HflC [Rhodospirillales bacterium]|nr:protease modulator HflC [Rhodospirillales bacterium]MDE2577081.1 protease modulator HflC [Rhodospirillales bacterium]